MRLEISRRMILGSALQGYEALIAFAHERSRIPS
jgi:hypothetical protein